MNIDDIYTPEEKGKAYKKANYNPLLDELIQNIDEGGERPDFMQMIKEHKEQFSYIDQTDLILIIERATELRNKGVN